MVRSHAGLPVRSGGSEGGRKVKSATVSLLMVMAPFLGVTAATSPDDVSVSRRIEVRVETLANREGGTVESCEVVQAKKGSCIDHVVYWSTLGGTGPSEAGASEKPGFDALRSTARCGPGALPDMIPSPSGAPLVPFLINEVSANVGWNPGAMDPGPVGAAEVSFTFTTRQRTGFSPEGKPLYSAPVTDHRTTRLEPGEEYLVPVLVDARGRETLGVREVLLRIRAGWAGREGGTEYGALAVVEAAPGSETVLDGGVAGRVGADGSLLLSTVPVGQREVRVRGVSGPVVSRIVSVVKGRTVLVTPGATGIGSPPQPSLTATGKNAEGFQEYRRVRDGAIMVQIP